MPRRFALSPQDQSALTAAQRQPDIRLRQKATAILLLHQGLTAAVAAEQVGVKSRHTIQRWLRRWRTAGLEGLHSRRRSGRPPTATPAYCQTLENLLQKQPADYNLAPDGWTVPLLRRLLYQQTHILLSEQRLRALLHRLGYSYQRVRYVWVEGSNPLQPSQSFSPAFGTWRRNKTR